MIDAIIVDPEARSLNVLEKVIELYCPEVKVCGKAGTGRQADILIREGKAGLIFLELDIPPPPGGGALLQRAVSNGSETIVVTHLRVLPIEKVRLPACAFVSKPVNSEDLVRAVGEAQRRLALREENQRNCLLVKKMLHQLSHDELIGIPTMRGFDFIHVEDIIRCEGLQRCTRIVTKTQSNLVSSYNLGEFIKMLEPYGFFSPHRSHLINLHYVVRYNREGSITMADQAVIPVSRRKKQEFLDKTLHL